MFGSAIKNIGWAILFVMILSLLIEHPADLARIFTVIVQGILDAGRAAANAVANLDLFGGK